MGSAEGDSGKTFWGEHRRVLVDANVSVVWKTFKGSRKIEKSIFRETF